MVKKKHTRTANEAEQHLGKLIERLRLQQGLTRMQLAREINVTQQQLEKYEQGAFIPLPMLEAIGEALDNPVPKRIIRRISNLRKLEIEHSMDQPELIDLYTEAFDEQ